MTNILEEIATAKKSSLEGEKKKKSLAVLKEECEKVRSAPSFLDAIFQTDKLSIIAEMKKASPSAGTLMETYEPRRIAEIYEASGASALSVLTEVDHFQGSPEHLTEARESSRLPILRKDFMIDPYQIYEAKALGASAVLLIVALLKEKQFRDLAKLAKSLGLDCLVEVHTEEELEFAAKEESPCIGINNRDLKTLDVDIETTFRLLPKVPKGTCIVSESGIKNPGAVYRLRNEGVHAALIGESILRSKNPGELLKSFTMAGKN